MEFNHNKANIPLARVLRKNMTPEEKHLWYDYLKNYPVRFVRQKTMGRYIVDFYCAKAKIVIEIDGSQHYSDKGYEYDVERTEYLEREFGVKVIRFTNTDIANRFAGVCSWIENEVEQSLSQRG